VKLLGSDLEATPMHLNPKETSDELLVLSAQSGDTSAFGELSNRYSERTLRIIYRITNDWHDAEDVLQETLMKAFKYLHGFESKASFSTWIYRIAINSALMLLRKRKTARAVTIDSDDTVFLWRVLEPIDHHENPEQHCVRRQREELLRRAILRLHPAYRKVVELQGTLSNKEIASVLGISPAAVRARLLRAKIALCAYVQRNGDSDVNSDQVLGPKAR
jgi:RNA polymerase sigma-70 factor (ECF subfamily)